MSSDSKQAETFGMHDLIMQTDANNRRSYARAKMLQAHSENLDLIRTNRQLKDEIAELQAICGALAAFAQRYIVRSRSLEKTIAHLRATWKAEGPESPAWTATDGVIQDFFQSALSETKADSSEVGDANSQIEAVKRKARESTRR